MPIRSGIQLSGAQRQLAVPAFPPSDWYVSLQVNPSKDLVFKIIDRKPPEEWVFFTGLNFSLDAKGALQAPRKHPVITGTVPNGSERISEFGLRDEPVTYVPLKDQKAVYDLAVEGVRSFAFTNAPKPRPDASGVDLDVRLEVNGRTLEVRYQKLSPDGCPEPVLSLLAILRRHLPADYNRLFDFLKVPKLEALSAEEAQKFAQCSLHKETMKTNEVRVYYGLPDVSNPYWKVRGVEFPNANSSVHAGCVSTPESPDVRQVLFCEKCRKAEEAWIKLNKAGKAP